MIFPGIVAAEGSGGGSYTAMITEDGDDMITESGDLMVTE